MTSGDLRYDYHTAAVAPVSVSVASASIGAGLKYSLAPWVALKAGLSGGYFLGFLNKTSTFDGNPFVSGEVGISFLPGTFHIDVAASYVSYFGLYNGLRALAGISYDIASGRPPA